MPASRADTSSRRPARRRGALGLTALLGAVSVIALGGPSAAVRPAVQLSGSGRSGLVPRDRDERGPWTEGHRGSASFAISGTVRGLYPGAHQTLVLTVTNWRAFTVVVTSMTTAVEDAGPACPSTYLTVTPFAGRLVVPAHGSATASVLASLDLSAPDACRGSVFPLIYAGLGHRSRP